MLKGGQNILETPCYSVNRTVPYFVEIDEEKEGTVNQVVYDEFTKLLMNAVQDLNEKGTVIEGAEKVPDGMMRIFEANEKKFSYKIQINDNCYLQYHRNNGIHKLGVITGNTTNWFSRASEGLLAMSDKMNQAYINSIFPDTYILTG